MGVSPKTMNLRERIPEHYAEILPVCPCGCEGIRAEDLPGDWELPDYVLEIQQKKLLTNTSWINCERSLIYSNKFVEEPLVHHMRHLRLLFPWITHDPNLVRLVRESLQCERDGKRMMHMIGHASSGKTNFMVLDAFRMIDIWPKYSECFVASPYRSASVYLLWNSFRETADLLNEHGRQVYKKATAISYGVDKPAGPGTITLVSFHAVGVLRGKKLINPNKGRLGVYLDEAGEFRNNSILHIIANLKSQPGLRVKTGTNFTSITGLDGRFNQPEKISWTDLSRETSYKWDSVMGARTIRLRAKVSPNIILDEDYYPYLLPRDEHNDLLAYGVDSPYYLAQGDAFPSVKSIIRLIISEADIQGGSAYEAVEFAPGTEEKYAFSDPSFTQHGDCSIITIITLGRQRNTGLWKIRPETQMEIQITDNEKWSEDYIELAKSLRGERGVKVNHEEGEPITPYDLNAIMAGRVLRENNVPFNNFGFDDSLRGQVTASYIYFLGEGVESVYYGAKPTNKFSFPPEFRWAVKTGTTQRTKVRMRCDEIFVNLTSQMWLLTSAAIKSGYLRDCFIVQRALDQMQQRLKTDPETAAAMRKIGIESKDEFKDRNNNRSPDHADSFCGACWLAIDRRLSPEMDASGASLRGNVHVAMQILGMQQHGELKPEPMFRRVSR